MDKTKIKIFSQVLNVSIKDKVIWMKIRAILLDKTLTILSGHKNV